MKRMTIQGTAVGTLLAGVALTAVTTTAAQAGVTGSADYLCTTPLGSTIPVPVGFASEALPTTIPAGWAVPAGALPVDLSVAIPAAFGDTLGFIGVTGVGGSSSDIAMGLGTATVPLTGVTVPTTPIVTGQDTVLTIPARTGAFTTPDAGTAALTVPAAFTFDALSQSGLPLGTLTCALAPGAAQQVGTVEVVKQASTTTARPARAKVPFGKRPVINAAVSTAMGSLAEGRVVVKKGTTKLASRMLGDGGTARLALPKLKPGRYTVAVRYLGSGATEASSTTTTFRVVR